MDRAQLIEFLEFPLGEDNMIPRMHSQAKAQWRQLIMRHAEELIKPHEIMAALETDRLENWACIASDGVAQAQERLSYIVKTLRGEKVK